MAGVSLKAGLDGTALDRLAQSLGPERFSNVMDEAVRSASDACREIRERAARGDLAGVAAAAQTVKPCVLDFGAERLAQRLDTLQVRARESQPGPWPEIGLVLVELGSFLDEVRRVRKAQAQSD